MSSASNFMVRPLAPSEPIHTSTAVLPPPRFPSIVALGGGTGLPVVLGGLAEALQAAVGEDNLPHWTDSLAAIVTVTDDGGSSGRLRRELGMLPPGDIRNCLAALSSDAAFKRLLAHRFDVPTAFDGHAVGNLMLAALTQMTGCFAAAINELATLLKARGRVYPSTIEDVTLQAELATGELVDGETAIVAHRGQIRRLRLARHVRPWPDALRALINADAIVVGPGSLYTSVLPNLLVDGVASTLSAVRGARIVVMNLMTQPGETDGLSFDDHLRVLQEHTGCDLFDYVLLNRTPPTAAQLAPYRSEGAELLRRDGHLPAAGSAQLIEADLLDTTSGQLRHDGGKLAAVILNIARRWRHPLYDPARPSAVPEASWEVAPGEAIRVEGSQKSTYGRTFPGPFSGVGQNSSKDTENMRPPPGPARSTTC